MSFSPSLLTRFRIILYGPFYAWAIFCIDHFLCGPFFAWTIFCMDHFLYGSFSVWIIFCMDHFLYGSFSVWIIFCMDHFCMDHFCMDPFCMDHFCMDHFCMDPFCMDHFCMDHFMHMDLFPWTIFCTELLLQYGPFYVWIIDHFLHCSFSIFKNFLKLPSFYCSYRNLAFILNIERFNRYCCESDMTIKLKFSWNYFYNCPCNWLACQLN